MNTEAGTGEILKAIEESKQLSIQEAEAHLLAKQAAEQAAEQAKRSADSNEQLIESVNSLIDDTKTLLESQVLADSMMTLGSIALQVSHLIQVISMLVQVTAKDGSEQATRLQALMEELTKTALARHIELHNGDHTVQNMNGSGSFGQAGNNKVESND